MRYTSYAAVFILLIAVQAKAQSADVSKCMEAVDFGAFKNTQMSACYAKELARQDSALNAEYKNLQSKNANPEAARALILGQRAWLSYRTAWCDYESKQMAAPSPEFNQLVCMVNLTAAQAKILHDDAN